MERSSDRLITDDDRFDADAQLKYHVDSILKRTNPGRIHAAEAE